MKLAGANLFLLLIAAGGIGIILGMGMPTTAVYILLATLMAPSIVETGVSKMAAHMFVLYFGMLSMITPPVALAAYAAANISKAGVMETGWAACRIGWVKFVLPFMFVLSPTLLMIGKPTAIVYDSITAFLGVYYATVGIVGYFQREIGPLLRVVMIVAGCAAILPDSAIGMIMPGLVSAAACWSAARCSRSNISTTAGRRFSAARPIANRYPNTSCSTPSRTTTVLSSVIVVRITGMSKCPAV